MWDDPKVWRWLTGGVLVAGLVAGGWVGYVVPRLNAGVAAVVYLNKCVEAKVCPTFDQLADRIKQNEAATATKAPIAQPPTVEKKD